MSHPFLTGPRRAGRAVSEWGDDAPDCGGKRYAVLAGNSSLRGRAVRPSAQAIGSPDSWSERKVAAAQLAAHR